MSTHGLQNNKSSFCYQSTDCDCNSVWIQVIRLVTMLEIIGVGRLEIVFGSNVLWFGSFFICHVNVHSMFLYIVLNRHECNFYHNLVDTITSTDMSKFQSMPILFRRKAPPPPPRFSLSLPLHGQTGPCIYRFFLFRFQICERKTDNEFVFRFSFSNLRTKNEKRIPLSFFVFKSEVRKTKNEFVFRFSFSNVK